MFIKIYIKSQCKVCGLTEKPAEHSYIGIFVLAMDKIKLYINHKIANLSTTSETIGNRKEGAYMFTGREKELEKRNKMCCSGKMSFSMEISANL